VASFGVFYEQELSGILVLGGWGNFPVSEWEFPVALTVTFMVFYLICILRLLRNKLKFAVLYLRK